MPSLNHKLTSKISDSFLMSQNKLLKRGDEVNSSAVAVIFAGTVGGVLLLWLALALLQNWRQRGYTLPTTLSSRRVELPDSRQVEIKWWEKQVVTPSLLDELFPRKKYSNSEKAMIEQSNETFNSTTGDQKERKEQEELNENPLPQGCLEKADKISNSDTDSKPTSFLRRDLIRSKSQQWKEEDSSTEGQQSPSVWSMDDVHKMCSICLHEYTAEAVLRRLFCHHHFHAECVDQWLLNKSIHKATCPVCKSTLLLEKT